MSTLYDIAATSTPYAQNMTELAVPLALFLVMVAAGVRLIRAFPPFRILGRSARTSTLLLAILVLLAAPISLGARSYNVLAAGIIPGVILATAALLLALGFACLYVACRADPARGRVRCPGCWYDLSATAAPVCPECGRTSTPRQRIRTKRSPRLALLGILLVGVATFGAKAPQVRDHGRHALIPTTALILGLERLPDWMIDDPAAPSISATSFVLGFAPAGATPATPTPSWDLRTRVATMWPWQRDLLRWRVRRIFAASTDFEHIERARLFLDATRPPRLSSDASATYVELLLRDDPAVRNLRPLDPYFPDVPSPTAQRRIAAASLAVLGGDNVDLAVRATRFVPFAPAHASPLADSIAQRVERAELSFVFAGVDALAPLANQDEHAWHVLRGLAEHPTRHVRYYVAGALADLSARRADAAQLALRLLRDENEDVARNALSSLNAVAPDVSQYAPQIWSAALRGPNLWTDALNVLHDRSCESAAYRNALRSTLASDNPEHVRRALRALLLLGTLDTATSQAIQTLAASGRSREAAGELAAVLTRFNITDANTKAAVPDPVDMR